MGFEMNDLDRPWKPDQDALSSLNRIREANGLSRKPESDFRTVGDWLAACGEADAAADEPTAVASDLSGVDKSRTFVVLSRPGRAPKVKRPVSGEQRSIAGLVVEALERFPDWCCTVVEENGPSIHATDGKEWLFVYRQSQMRMGDCLQ